MSFKKSMELSRLPLNSLAAALMAGASACALFAMSTSDASAAGCAAGWSGTKVYTQGNPASVGSTNYVANWWTLNNEPQSNSGGPGSGKPWTSQGACSGGTAPPPTNPPPTNPPPTNPPPTNPPPTNPPPTNPPPSNPPPTNPPPTTPPGVPSSIAKHALVGYWHNFTNPAGPTYPLSQVSNSWDVIVVAFADNAGLGNVSFTLDPGAGSEAQFIADIAELKRKGKKVVLSLGGQNGSVSVGSAAEANNFTNSLYGIMKKYGFDGVDLDLENGVVHGSPIQTYLVSSMKALKAKVGSSFYLSMAPEFPYVQGGYVAYGSIWGAYLPIIDGLRNELSIIHVQYYNNGGLYSPYQVNPLTEGSVDMLVGGSKMLIEGFPLANGTAGTFAGLRPDQVAFGVPSGPRSANSGFVTSTTVNNAVDCMVKLTGCGSIRPKQAYPTFRGVMTWSINWDRFDNYSFSAPIGAHLKSLP